jgi:hypothetical protein
LGDEGVLYRSDVFRGELTLGDCGSGVFAATWSERRFKEFGNRFASLFVDCRAALGAASLGPGAENGCFCMLAVKGRKAARGLFFCAGVLVFVASMVVFRRKFAMTEGPRRLA